MAMSFKCTINDCSFLHMTIILWLCDACYFIAGHHGVRWPCLLNGYIWLFLSTHDCYLMIVWCLLFYCRTSWGSVAMSSKCTIHDCSFLLWGQVPFPETYKSSITSKNHLFLQTIVCRGRWVSVYRNKLRNDSIKKTWATTIM